jgi:hypothetical protein
MRVLVLCGLMLLAGCSFFGGKPEYQRAGTSPEVANGDLESCRQQARAMIQRDRQIDTDIGSQDVTSNYLQSDSTLESNLSQYHESNRYDAIVLDCMSKRGYSAGGQ